MAEEQKYDLTSAAKDPDFLKASNGEKIAFLSAHDPDFAAAPPNEKAEYLNHILGNTGEKTQFEKERTPEGSSLVRGLKAVGGDIAGVIGGTANQFGKFGKISTSIPAMAAEIGMDTARRQQQGRSPAYQVAAATGSMTGVADPNASEDAAERGDTAGVVGHTVVPAVGAALGAERLAGGKVSGPLADAATKFYRNKALAFAKQVYNPDGTLSPGAQAIAKPLTNAPEYVLRKLISDPNEDIRVRNAALEQRAMDLERRGRQQEMLDRKAAVLAKAQAKNAPAPSPFPGATPTNVPVGDAQLPGNPTPFAQPKAQPAVPGLNANAFEATPKPGKSAIIDPNNIPADEVTFQSVPWAELKNKAMAGDKFAIDEVIRRGREAEIPGLSQAVAKRRPYPRIGNQ